MSVYVVIQWSVPEGSEPAIETALGVIREHIAAEHPAISSTRMFRQFAGPMPHRAYSWYEEYASLAALEAQESTPECDTVWEPVRALAFPGTFTQTVWSDAGKAAWLQR